MAPIHRPNSRVQTIRIIQNVLNIDAPTDDGVWSNYKSKTGHNILILNFKKILSLQYAYNLFIY
jgi:hypothetical protein